MTSDIQQSRAQISTAAIQRLHIAMRHLFIRGSYKPLGMSGEAMIEAMLMLRPEIYGSIADPERVELNGLHYIFQRLPQGIEECRFIKLISREGFENSNFPAIIPSKRRRNCYRIDDEQMFIEMTRGRSDIYDVMTHLTFMYIEAEKIRRNSLDSKDRKKREWKMLKSIVEQNMKGEKINTEVAYTYLSTILGRTYDDTVEAAEKFAKTSKVNNLFRIAYWLGQRSIEEHVDKNDREISFSSALREKLGHHIYGELWANNVKKFLFEKGLLDRPIHIISANPHSVMNSIFAKAALTRKVKFKSLEDLVSQLSLVKNEKLRDNVKKYALKNGMYELDDATGTNISVQIFDGAAIDFSKLPPEILGKRKKVKSNNCIIIVMDYAFGEQAYETMDELLKPYEHDNEKIPMPVQSVNVMGKAGILIGKKRDIMIPTAHVFEGTADNYPFENDLDVDAFKNKGLNVVQGPMITVLGTSLQNKDILAYFLKSSWGAVGLEMEGAHYQKAIQAAATIRKGIRSDVKLRYAYYASDNPLETGSTLASGALGLDGVKPTYMITVEILKKILNL